MSFYNPKVLGGKGLLVMVDAQHHVRLEKDGDLVDAGKGSLLAGAPVFSATSGADLHKRKDWFSDGEDRVLAWRESSVYPFTVLVGLAREELLAPAKVAWRERRDQALAAPCVLLLAALGGSAVSRRRLQEQSEQAALRESYRVATEGAADGFYMARAIRNGHAPSSIFKSSTATNVARASIACRARR